MKKGKAKPRRSCLTRRQILAWADDHFGRTGKWPRSRSGPVVGAPSETWQRLEYALRFGSRGLAAGSSLAQLLAQKRGLRNRARLPPLTPQQIVAWAEHHRAQTGRWPSARSGPVGAMPGENWWGIDLSLRQGLRGLAGGSSMALLLAQTGCKRNQSALPSLSIPQLLGWAQSHYQRTGNWPRLDGGPVTEAPEETWQTIESALRHGYRGLPGGSSLARVLRLYRNLVLRAHWEEGLTDGRVRVESPARLVEILIRQEAPIE